MEAIFDGIMALVDFFSSDGEASIWARIAAHIYIWWLQVKIAGLAFTWQVAGAMLNQLGVTQMIANAWAGVDSQSLQLFTALRVPDSLNILIQAWVTRFVLNFL